MPLSAPPPAFCLSSPLPHPPFIGSRDQGSALLRCFCNCHHFTLQGRSMFFYLKLRNTWFPLRASLWAQDLTLFALYNFWHICGLLWGLTQSRGNESIEETQERKRESTNVPQLLGEGQPSRRTLFCLTQDFIFHEPLLLLFFFF